MLDETMDSVRRISHDMAAGIFAEKGIEGALQDLCKMFEQPGKMEINLNMYGFRGKSHLTIEKNLYQIVRELLANIVKHAEAQEVTIQLIKSNENINLTVEDNGRGFDVGEARKKKGMGLSNIDRRVENLSGQWSIDSGKGRGSIVIIDIPINENSE
jgi:signal transduction histidine kinase